jgi:outer membrane protein OmpA-like peptidoglycan-associated protein
MFAKTLAKEPAPPLRFSLYFNSGAADITPESQPELDKIFAATKSRNSCDISSIGHSDTVGDNTVNQPLSLRRAENVKSALITRGLSDKCIDIRYYGENDLAVPTPDNVAEAKNRRVEVEIR